ncbi:MAG: hypothetical protein NW237_13470 [Cyanobacteriota bacterium]|nr:hypothetical protein [Cyanobacteriota bacterium]
MRVVCLAWFLTGCGGETTSSGFQAPPANGVILVDPVNGPIKTLQDAVAEADRQQNATPNLNILIEIVNAGSEQLTTNLSLDGGNGTNGGKVTVQANNGFIQQYEILTGLADLIVPSETQINDLSVSLNNGGQLKVTGGQVNNSKVTVASEQSQINVSGSALSGLLDLVIDCQRFASACVSVATDATLQRLDLTHSSQQPGSIGIKVESGSSPNILDSLLGIVGAANQVGIQFEADTAGKVENVEVDGAKEAGGGDDGGSGLATETRANVTRPTTGIVLASSDANPTIRQSRFRVGQFSSSAGIRILAGVQERGIAENEFVASRSGSGIGIRVAAGTSSLVVNNYITSNTFDENLLVDVSATVSSPPSDPDPDSQPNPDPQPTPSPSPSPTPSLAPSLTVVTNANNSGAGSLRQAIINANSAETPINITFSESLVAFPITISLETSLPAIENEVTITGSEASVITLDGQTSSRIFEVTPGNSLTLSGLTLSRGFDSQQGGAIFNNAGTLTLENVVVTESEAPVGGGIYNADGILTIIGGSLSGNQATGLAGEDQTGGGAIQSVGGVLTLIGAELADNRATGDGGAVLMNGGFLTVSNTTFLGNLTNGANPFGSDGGALFAIDSTLSLDSTTISGNIAADDAGAGTFHGSSLNISNSEISNNQAGDAFGGISLETVATFSITSTTISGNASGTGTPAPDNDDGSGVGGVGVFASTGNIIDSEIQSNDAFSMAGGLFINGGSSVMLSNSRVDSNQANLGEGGGIFIDSSSDSLEIVGGSFLNNTASSDGGAIFNSGGSLSPSGIPSVGDGVFQGILFIGNSPNNLNL